MQRTRRTSILQDELTAPPSPSWVRAAKQLDFYYKPDADAGLLKRSRWGGAITIIMAIILVYLVVSEVVEYIVADSADVLTVDKRRGVLLPIYLDITFPSLTCVDVALDVVEASSGATLEEAAHQIIKQRLDVAGATITQSQQKELGKRDSDYKQSACPSCLPTEVPRNLLKFLGNRDAGMCCHSCEDVRSYLLRSKLPQALAESTEQCKIAIPQRDDEGCRVFGFLQVPRGKGDFHIAAGAGFAQSHDSHEHHMHQIDWARIHLFNITHHVNSLSFGPASPDILNPLNGHSVMAHTLAQHMYMIQVVPTEVESGGESILTNQYAFTQHHQKIAVSGGNFQLPGVYFKYEINPLMIKITKRPYSFANFLVRICAIVGGLYVAFGIMYSLTTKVAKTTKRLSISQ